MSETLVAVENLDMKKIYRFNHDDVKLSYLGTKNYSGDPRTWYQFSMYGSDGVWSELLEGDLHFLVEVV